MKKTIDAYDFVRQFELHGRTDNFSRAALFLLFEYFEELEADTGEEVEFDCVAICCDFTELDWQTVASEYRIDLDDCEDEEEREEAVIEYLQDNTQYIGQTVDGLVFANF